MKAELHRALTILSGYFVIGSLALLTLSILYS